MKGHIIMTGKVAKCLCLSLLLSGCSLKGASSMGDEALRVPDTSTILGREAFIESETEKPAERKPGEVTISYYIRPRFILHLNRKNRVYDFEALNYDARILKEQCEGRWEKKNFKKAIRRILEQAIIDGYISDNNGPVFMLVEREPAQGVSEDADLREMIELEALNQTEEIVKLHGISSEIEPLGTVESDTK